MAIIVTSFEKNMNTSERLHLLDECLGRPTFKVRYETFKSYLEDKFDVVNYSTRTFHRDLSDLREKIDTEFPSLVEQHGDLIHFDKRQRVPFQRFMFRFKL